MATKKQIQLSADHVRTFLRDLEVLVVSLDRLGSAFHDKPERLAIETDKFFSAVHAFKRLARMRRVLSEAYDSQSSMAEIARLEKNLERIRLWKSAK
jgi:hypothetical protein